MAADELDSRYNFVALYSAKFPHILEHIFFSLDYESYKDCLNVSNEWKGVLNSKRYITKRKSIYKIEILEDEKKLCNAAKQGNTDELRMVLASGMVDVNCSQCEVNLEWTSLHWAAERDHIEVAKLLLESGAEVNKADDIGRTPLQVAAFSGHKEVAELLIEHGADPNVNENNGQTPIHVAAMSGHKEVTELLIEHGADPNVVDNHGKTPLHWAARMGRKELTQLFIEYGADPNVVENHGQTPLHWAARGGQEEVAELLIESGADMDKGDNIGTTPRDIMQGQSAMLSCYR